MLQDHSFFSQPLIFFGSSHTDGQEMEEECDLNPSLIPFDINLANQIAPRTELFFHWYSLDE